MTDAIIKQNTRILTPGEYEKLRGAMQLPYYPIICDALLLSGMRPIEFKRFEPDWYKASRRIIKLPEGACEKDKCEFKERTISLSLAGCDAFDRLISAKVRFKKNEVSVLDMRPEKVSFRDTLRRYAVAAGLPDGKVTLPNGEFYTGPDAGISPKMFRKTLVSWLVACLPERAMYIESSMGHSNDTIVKNYLGLGFTRDEIDIMRTKYLDGWGILV